MPSLSEVDIAQVEERLTPGRLRVFQIVHVVLAVGIMSFLVMLLFFFGLGSDLGRSEASPTAMEALSIAMIVLTGLALIGGQAMYRRLFSAKRLERFATEPMRDKSRVIDDPAEKCLMIVQQATVVRAAIFDAAAFFGVVVAMVGMMQGTLFMHPIFILNALPAFIQLLFLGATFPTRDRVLNLVRRMILERR